MHLLSSVSKKNREREDQHHEEHADAMLPFVWQFVP